jgi:hypothetical protein
VEVTRPDLLETIEASVALPSGELPVTIRHIPGEEAWAAHMEELAHAALPLLAELFGSPPEDAERVEIAERGYRDTRGYEGVARCLGGGCEIAISPVSDDFVALHEMAHLWTTPYRSRWLAEGLAEFMAERASEQLGGLVSRAERVPPDRIIDQQLHDWGSVTRLVGASEEQRIKEESGYIESLRVFELLEERVGLAAIQEANRSAFAKGAGSVDSRFYLDYLEAASGTTLEDLFLAEVFTAAWRTDFEERREARARLAFLTAAAEDVGLPPPAAIQRDIDDWALTSAFDRLDSAQAALEAYVAAEAKVTAARNLWERLGMFGEDPEDNLEQAASDFGEGLYAQATRQADAASATMDGTNERALTRLLIVLGVWAGIVAAGILVFLVLRRIRRRRQAKPAA